MKDFFNMLHIDEPDAVFDAVIDEKGYLKLPEIIELEPEMILTNFVEKRRADALYNGPLRRAHKLS